MDAKHKAIRLINRMKDAIWLNGNPNHVISHAKECAIVLCEEMLDSRLSTEDYQYWQSVRNEIEKHAP